MDIQLYDKLLELPLFQGMSRNDLTQVVGHTKFDFHKYGEGKTIVKEGMKCDRMLFLLNGKMSVESFADDHSYSFVEDIPSPYVLQPECIFGLSQRYTRTFTAKTVCNLISIDKNETMKLSDSFMIFRLNLLNIISTLLQKMERQPWRHKPDDLRQRIVRFVEGHCLRPAGEKHIYIKMRLLATEINDSRRSVSCALKDLQAEGLVSLRRGEIEIPALEKCLLK